MSNVGMTVSLSDLKAIRSILYDITEPEIPFSFSTRKMYMSAIREMQANALVALEIIHVPLERSSEYCLESRPGTAEEVIEWARRLKEADDKSGVF